MKKLTLLLCTIIFVGTLAAQGECPCKIDTVEDTPSYETAKPSCDIKEEKSCRCRLTRAEVYQRLCLNQCQIDQANDFFDKYKCASKELKNALKCEKDKLCQMLKGCYSNKEIKEQKRKIKNLKQDIKEKWNCYDEQLKEILTKQQLKDYKSIRKQEKARCKKSEKHDCCN